MLQLPLIGLQKQFVLWNGHMIPLCKHFYDILELSLIRRTEINGHTKTGH